MNRKQTAVHPHKAANGHPPHALWPRRMHKGDVFEHLDERLHGLRDALRAARQGDFTVRLPTDDAADGVMSEVALAFNALIEENEALVTEIRRVERNVGFEGKTTERASLASGGSWGMAVGSVAVEREIQALSQRLNRAA